MGAAFDFLNVRSMKVRSLHLPLLFLAARFIGVHEPNCRGPDPDTCKIDALNPLFFTSCAAQIIMERNQQLTPAPADSFTLLKFVTRIRQKLDALVLAPNSFAACVRVFIVECRDHHLCFSKSARFAMSVRINTIH